MSTAHTSLSESPAAADDRVCLRCRVPVTPVSTWRWKLICVLAWPLAMFSPMLVFGVLGLFAVVPLPFGVFLSGAILARLHERAFGPPRCPRCGRIVLPRAEAGHDWQRGTPTSVSAASIVPAARALARTSAAAVDARPVPA